MVPELARVWVKGLAVARRNPPPVEVAWGLRVDVGRPKERVRHVLLRTDEAAVRSAAAEATVPNIWIKAFIDPERALTWLGPNWQYGGTNVLMTTTLSRAAPRVPDDYTVTAEVDDGITHVRVRTAAGEVAAAGYAAVVDGVAVVDRVETYPAHQRRGLGTLVMQTLAGTAVENGARAAVLSATVEGRALYETLGWTLCAPLAEFVHRP